MQVARQGLHQLRQGVLANTVYYFDPAGLIMFGERCSRSAHFLGFWG